MMSTRSKTTETTFSSVTEALQVFNAGPTNPAWDEAACYLLSENTPTSIQEHVETKLTETLQAFYGFAFQPDACTETGESVMTVQGFAKRTGIDQQQVLGWAHRLESRLGESILHHPNQLTYVKEAAA
ncbi:MAG: hypothetical protein HC808_15210 [Candidatus Competibacteraceae bacterium]|nr:hypothetical protein [Candidatus Competibacteraceae bacterium]